MSKSNNNDPEHHFSLWADQLSDFARAIGEFDAVHDAMIVEFEVLFETGATRWALKDVHESIDELRQEFVICIQSIENESTDVHWRIQTVFNLFIHEEQLRTNAVVQLTPFASVPFVTHDKQELQEIITEHYLTDISQPQSPDHFGTILEKSILATMPLLLEQVEIGEPARREQKRRKLGKNAIKSALVISGATASAFLARLLFS